mmetsp:Transcript_26874/g.67554  ORF Transcript_26874/g.67554 Transcript_26874/m.67554 type:complete len:133 (-) Transcript_26874:184-582(-)
MAGSSFSSARSFGFLSSCAAKREVIAPFMPCDVLCNLIHGVKQFRQFSSPIPLLPPLHDAFVQAVNHLLLGVVLIPHGRDLTTACHFLSKAHTLSSLGPGATLQGAVPLEGSRERRLSCCSSRMLRDLSLAF